MQIPQASWSNCLLLATALIPSLVLGQPKTLINVALKTSFDSGPYLIELLETAALENSTSYFPLLDRIAEGTFADLQNDRDLYEKFLEVLQEDGHLSNKESLSSFKYALALHAAAPRVEAHYQYYRTSVEPRMMAAQDAACPVWVYLDGQQYCSSTLERAQQPIDIDDADIELPFDRSLGSASDVPISVLYADITHPLFGQFHETVSGTAKEGKSIYRLRHRPSNATPRKLFVGGYGTELVLKRTDYIVIDDRDAAKKDDNERKDEQQVEKIPDLKPLTTSELSSLALDAASYIMSSEKPFDTLMDVSADFPRYSSIISQHNATQDFLTEHFANRETVLPPGLNAVWMNGLSLDQRQMNAYSLMDTLKSERRLIGQLQDIGLNVRQAVDVLSHEVLAQILAEDEPQRYDWRDVDENKSVIIWMNNIEHDKRYAGWTPLFHALLQRTYPGQLPQVRRNIHNLIYPIDFNNIEDLETVVNSLQTFVKRLIPIRIGLLPVGSSKIATQGMHISYNIMRHYGIGSLLKFLQNVVESKEGVNGMQPAFETALQDREPREGMAPLSFADATGTDNIAPNLEAVAAYRARLSLDDSESPVIINGIFVTRDDSWFDKVSQRLMLDLRTIQIAVYEGQFADEMDIQQFLLYKATSRRNTLVIPPDPKNVTIISVADLVTNYQASFDKLPRLQGGDSSLLSERALILLVVDLNNQAGKLLAEAAADFHVKHPETEIVIMHNPASDDRETTVSAKIGIRANSGSPSLTTDMLKEVLSTHDTANELSESEKESAHDFWAASIAIIRNLGLAAGENGICINGRTVGPIFTNFEAEDFEALFEYEKSLRIAPVTTAITGLALEDKFTTPVDLAKITSIIARSLKSDLPQGIFDSQSPERSNVFKKWAGQFTLIHVASDPEATIEIIATIDPASEAAQPLIPILRTLSELDGVDVKIYLNPKNKLEELPVKRFYRQVISSAPSFDEEGFLQIPRASFKDIPQETLFNLGLVVPPSWLVAAKNSVYDLDNIKLSSVPSGQNVDAIYELEHILIEGHSRDSSNAKAPRGVQLLLGTEQNKHFADTIIMANLGYFQFKANPGYWQLTLKPGPSSKIFQIDSVGARGYAPQPGDETTAVALLSFQGVTLYPRLSRKPGMENEDVLETTATGVATNYLSRGASFASSAFSSLGFKKGKTAQHADINIFSVASGHLYERMLNIMMVSVMRHTEHSVKFWFIEQFLSPSFKSSLPNLASHYGFQYEMVTYKWPHWLRSQKEKQRVIWGYKILFLDVLFPLDLDKVIFVDADQIVRTDMMELNKIDLQGAPYGFTPMCDSRTEMEGFRFWKQGYWKNYLAGKPYHISALYVVDLKKFRQLAAGDRLRQQYHALSADPASLANLDQDLPNHMQHALPIHSLPQEWLWCETWCSDESLAQARTIDLCNNPQTKEPKLDRARRQVPEWTEYDEEIAQVLQNTSANNRDIMGDGAAGVQETEQQILHDEQKIKDEL